VVLRSASGGSRVQAEAWCAASPGPADGRFTKVILTQKGFQTVVEAAPAHVAHVRSLVIDVLSPEHLATPLDALQTA